MTYKISVIIPVYNAEKYIKKCLDSVINQTLGIENIEVILVNDCSLDNTMEIISDYAEKYPSFKIIELDLNKGQGNARNIGLKHVSSDYLTFIDSDDYLSLNTYENSLNKMKKNDCDLLAFNSEIFSDISEKMPPDIHQLNIDEDMIVEDLNDYPKIIFSTSVWNKIFSKKLFKYLNFPSKLYEDNYVAINTLFNAKKIYLNSESNYYYRKNEDKSSTTTDITLKNCMDLSESILNLFSLGKDYLKYNNLITVLNLKFTYDIIFWLFDKIFFINEENKIINEIRPFANKFSKKDMNFLRELSPEQLTYDDFILNIEKYDNEFLIAKYKYFDNLPYLNSVAYLYVDTGNDFNEDEKIVINYELKSLNSLTFDLSNFKNIKKLRFDPIKQYFIKCKIYSIYSNDKNITFSSNSDQIHDNYSYFSNINPYYVLEGNLENISHITIEFSLYFLESIELNKIFEKKEKTINNKNEEIKYLNEELDKWIKNKYFNY